MEFSVQSKERRETFRTHDFTILNREMAGNYSSIFHKKIWFEPNIIVHMIIYISLQPLFICILLLQSVSMLFWICFFYLDNNICGKDCLHQLQWLQYNHSVAEVCICMEWNEVDCFLAIDCNDDTFSCLTLQQIQIRLNVERLPH